MRTSLFIVIVASLVFATGAFALDQSTQSGMSSMGSTDRMMDSSQLMGKSLTSSDGKDIGTISDVAVDPNTHAIAYAIVSYEGKSYPVPFNALKMTPDNKIALNVSRDKFLEAPTLAAGTTPDLDNSRFTSRVHDFYGVAPSWGSPAAPGSSETTNPAVNPELPSGAAQPYSH